MNQLVKSVTLPVYTQGLLYVLIAWFTFNQAYLGGDEAAKYISPMCKFWLNWIIGSGATICASLKMYCSSAYAEHVEEKKRTGNTDQFTKP